MDALPNRHYALKVESSVVALGSPDDSVMKLAGFLLLVSGWGIALIAVAILASGLARSCFVLAGLGVEILGLVLVVRSHPLLRAERR